MTAREGGEDQPTRATLVARFLRQRRELGHDPLVLERLPGPDPGGRPGVHPVSALGDPDLGGLRRRGPLARVMVVGEAPGANEDETGLPFVGAAGNSWTSSWPPWVSPGEENVYICNVIKCRPPGNRNPRKDEIESLLHPLPESQIELVRPEVILAVGTFAGQLLTGRTTPGKAPGSGTVTRASRWW
jgi:hypothetical protein